MLWPGLIVLMAAERHRPLAWMAIGSGIANLVLSIILVRRFGLVGVALGTLIPTVVEAAFFFLPYVLRTLDVTLVHLVREVYLRVAPAALALTAILVLGRVLVDSPSIVEILGVVTAGGVVYVSVYVSVGATTAERRFYGGLAASMARHAGIPWRRSRPSG
jgi:O-antigen/teichoic acid export membrane protein